MFSKLRAGALLLIPAVFAGAPAPALAAPVVKLSPTQSHPSSSTKASGSGFSANKAIDIYWDTTDELLAVSDGTGAFSSKIIAVPGDALPGQHWVTAVERDTGDAAQAAFVVRTDWAARGFNARGKRFNPWENVISPANIDKVETAWTFTTNGAVDSSPAVVNGILYVGSGDGSVYALDATLGTFKWSYQTQGPIDYSSPAAAGGIVYVGSSDHNVYALSSTTGALKWSYATGGAISSSPTIAGGTVYIGSNDGFLYALDASTGAQIWSALTTANAPIISAPAVADGLVYLGSGDHSVYAFDAATGAKRWSFPTGNTVASSPAVSNGMLYIGSYDHSVWARDARHGSATSTFGTGGLIFSSPAVAKRRIFVGSADDYLYALHYSSADGAVLQDWRFYTGASIHSSPAVANGIVYFGSDTGFIEAMALSGGAVLWEANTGAAITSAPAVANGMIYIGSAEGTVYAYALEGGTQLYVWQAYVTPGLRKTASKYAAETSTLKRKPERSAKITTRHSGEDTRYHATADLFGMAVLWRCNGDGFYCR